MSVKFSGNYVKENKSIYPVKSVMNIYIVYSLDTISNTRNTDFTSQNCLFGAVKITKDLNTSHYKYVGYGICFDEGSSFSFGNITNGKHVIILGSGASSSSHANNEEIILLYWVKTLSKVLHQMVQEIQSMSKMFTNIILQNQIKSLFCHYIKMVIILIYLLMEKKN